MVRAASTKVRFRLSTMSFCCGVRATDVCLIVTESDSTHKFLNKVDELRAVSCHMLGASGVQITENNLDNLKLTREVDGTSKALDPQN
ncbi:hypothetical protein Tco_1077798 [Tanacetum coccineum]